MAEKMVNYVDGGRQLIFDKNGYAVNVASGFPPFPAGNNAWYAANWRDILITLVGTGNVKVLGSIQELPPDFSAPSTITNSYAEITLADYAIPATFYAGNAGVTVAGATALVEVDTNLLTWIAIVRDVDTVDVLLTITNAQ
jgi:hypothetical protein